MSDALNEILKEEAEQLAFDIPTDPKVLLSLRDGLKAIEDSKIRAAGERTFQTEKFKDLVKLTNIPSSVIRKLANVVADGGVQNLVAEVGNLEALYVAINNPLELQIAENTALAMGQLNPVLTASEDAVQAAIKAEEAKVQGQHGEERRVFAVDAGEVPKEQAQQAVESLINAQVGA